MADRTRSVAAFVALSAALAGCAGGTDAGDPSIATTHAAIATVPPDFDLVEATLSAPDDDAVELTLWLAASPDQWHQGLTGVTDLGLADGMLFEFDRQGSYRFHMWQTPMPLDIYFFDAAGRYVDMQDMAPCLDGTNAGCERYESGVPFLSAIEVPAGSLDSVDVGDSWTLSLGERVTPPTTTDPG